MAIGVLGVLALTPVGASAATVRVSTAGDDATCAPDGAACRSIERGVAVAAGGDIVQVGAGDFPVFSAETTGVHITKPLDLRGAQFGVDARGRAGAPETVLHPAGNTPYQGLLYVDTGASGTSIRGFRIEGTPGSEGAGGAGIFTAENGDDGGYTFSENIITGNTMGMFLSSSGPTTVVSHNVFLANTLGPGSAAGNGIYSERNHNVQIVENRFENNEQTGVLTAVGAANRGTDNVFRGNESINEAGAVFVNQADLTVADNTFTGGERTGIALGGDGLRNAKVVENTITGRSGVRPNGIRLLNFGSGDNHGVEILRNTITNIRSDDAAQGNGIWIGTDGADGHVRIANNRLVDTSGAGLRNEDPDAQVDARRNWWGCNKGPGSAGCSNATSPNGGIGPALTPWLTLSLGSTVAQIAAGGSATVLARLANLSNGGFADGPFFDTASSAFGSTPAGTFNPAGALLSANNLSASSAFTAGARPTELRVTVDHQTVRILNADPPTPDVVPDLDESDHTLTPGQKVAAIVGLTNRGNRTARSLKACLRLSAKLRLTGKRCRDIARLRPGHTLIFRVLARARTSACRGRIVNRLRLQVAGQPLRVRRAFARLLAGPGTSPPCPTASSAGRTPRAAAAAFVQAYPRPPRPPATIRAHAAC